MIKLLLDSGSFSTWNKNEPELNLNGYIAYLKRNKEHLFSYVVLDQIPGQYGRKRTTTEVELSAKKSYDNLQIMKSHGLKPIPVFHQDEDFKWLERMLADGETYIGFSSSKETGSKTGHLNRAFSMICDNKGNPLIHIHGFGITKPSFLLNYPFYTTDSTTWALTPAFGKIIVPAYTNEKPDYTKPPIGVAVSGVPGKANNKMQFGGFGDLTHEFVLSYIEQELKMKVSDLRYSQTNRMIACLTYYCNLMKYLPAIQFDYKHNGFFHSLRPRISNTVKPSKMKIMFATNYSQGHILNMVPPATTRLLSYYELKDRDDGELHRYVQTGTLKQRISKSPKGWHSESYRNFRRLKLHDKLVENGDVEAF